MTSGEPAAAQQPLAGRHAVVTGAGRGIGAACASALVADGARVSLLGRDRSRLEQTAARLGGPRHAQPIHTDVAEPAAVARAFVAARASFGPVHILINNAGQARSAKFTDTDPALWHALLAVNLTGTYLCAREVVPDMLAEGFGRIVNIASVAGLRGGAYIAAYAAAKHGVIGLTRSLAIEYATRSITVNALCPGFTDTDIVRDAVANIVRKTGRTPEAALESLLASNPQRRLIQPAEVAHAMRWLVRPGTESVTGQSLPIAGGEVY